MKTQKKTKKRIVALLTSVSVLIASFSLLALPVGAEEVSQWLWRGFAATA